MKSKYNTGVPIDVNELSDEERKIAFHEWAEGSKALEDLLNEGYKRGFISHACCGGDTGYPYIDYELNNESSRKMAMYIAKELVDSGLDCKISFTHDFYQTEEEYKQMRDYLLKSFPEDFSEESYSFTRTITNLNVSAKMENREEVFRRMAKSVREAKLDNIKLPESEEEIPSKDFNTTIKKEGINQSDDGKKMIDGVVDKSKKDITLPEINSAFMEIRQTERNYIQEQSNPQQAIGNEHSIGG